MQLIDQRSARQRVGAQAPDPANPDHCRFHGLHRALPPGCRRIETMTATLAQLGFAIPEAAKAAIRNP
jgi:hypothetical protein